MRSIEIIIAAAVVTNLVFITPADCAGKGLTLQMEAVREKVDYGEPLVLRMHLILAEPYISPYSGKPVEVYNLDGLRLHIEDVNSGSKSVFIFRLPVRFSHRDNDGLVYHTTEVLLWDVNEERRKLTAEPVFDGPGKFRLVLVRAGKVVSNPVEVVVRPCEPGEKALSLLADPNDVAFLLGGLFESPKRVSTLEQVVRECERTVIAEWAAARLGVTYFKAFQKKQPSFEKAQQLYEQGRLEDKEFDLARQYLTKGARLPDEFPLRSEVLGELAQLQCITKDYQSAVNLLTELETKYPGSRHGQKASLWKEEVLAEMNRSGASPAGQ